MRGSTSPSKHAVKSSIMPPASRRLGRETAGTILNQQMAPRSCVNPGPTIIATEPIKAATGIAIIGVVPTLIATEGGLGRAGGGQTKDRFAARVRCRSESGLADPNIGHRTRSEYLRSHSSFLHGFPDCRGQQC